MRMKMRKMRMKMRKMMRKRIRKKMNKWTDSSKSFYKDWTRNKAVIFSK